MSNGAVGGWAPSKISKLNGAAMKQLDSKASSPRS